MKLKLLLSICRILFAPTSSIEDPIDICKSYLTSTFALGASIWIALYGLYFTRIFDPSIHHPASLSIFAWTFALGMVTYLATRTKFRILGSLLFCLGGVGIITYSIWTHPTPHTVEEALKFAVVATLMASLCCNGMGGLVL